MRIDDLSDAEPKENAGFASLAEVSLQRSAAGREKKSDITDTLKSMRPTPQYMRPDMSAGSDQMRDVTPVRSTDIVDYWNDLRASSPLPSRDSLQASDLAKRWPNLILFRCGDANDLRPDTTFATALRAHRPSGAGAVFEGGAEISALLSQWILTVARDTALKSAPCRAESKFDAARGRLDYQVVALPFGAGAVDHVLCNVEFAPTAT